MTNRKNLGLVIKEYRLNLRLTQREVASRIGTTVTYLSMLENGHRGASIDTLDKLAAVFEIATWYLLRLSTLEQEEK